MRRLKPEQRDALEAVLAGQDALVVLPTGFGKSLIYQAAALTFDRPTIVVSPLLALMRDQERALARVGAPVVRLDSTLRAAERREALARIADGGTLIALTTPETLESEAAWPALEAARPRLLCVDEAHCISEWGHDFRPAYLRLGAMRRALGIDAALALTATATPRVIEDIEARLALDAPQLVRAPPHRENLALSVESVPGNLKFERAGRLLKRLARPGIVYCATTRAVDEVHAALTRARIPAARYHGKMKAADREAAQRRFMRPSKRIVMVATSAFGMGIDKPNIRYVLHFQAPGSLEQYVQEAGRAGRDGKAARCVLLFDPDDMAIQEHLLGDGPTGAQLRRVAEAAAAYGAEEKTATAKELALAARAPTTATRAICAQLEQLGVLRCRRSRWEATADPDALLEAADDLRARFEVKRLEDMRRLRSVPAYAETEGCRSAFLRRWFGEDDPPACGRCDRCQRRERLEAEVERAVDRAKRERRPRRRRRR